MVARSPLYLLRSRHRAVRVGTLDGAYPAYLADIFGTQFVGAIHGRLLTSWSTAGIIGPVVVNYIHEAQIAAGEPRESVYDFTMYILAGMLALGFICDALVRPLSERWFMKDEKLRALRSRVEQDMDVGSMGIGQWRLNVTSVLAWLAVGVPIAWGVGSRCRTPSCCSNSGQGTLRLT